MHKNRNQAQFHHVKKYLFIFFLLIIKATHLAIEKWESTDKSKDEINLKSPTSPPLRDNYC